MLSEAERRLYARQVLLRELGAAGQARLCGSRVAIGDGDARAARVAQDYLQRAGLRVGSERGAGVHVVQLAAQERVRQVAGHEALADCAAWLLGAFAAVETIKRCADLGTPAQIDARFALRAEEDE